MSGLFILQNLHFNNFFKVLNSLTTQLANYIFDIELLQNYWEYTNSDLICEFYLCDLV